MPRPRAHSGELGKVSFTVLANGRVQARARFRDDSGEVRRPRGIGANETEAEIALHQQVDAIVNDGVGPSLTVDSTIEEACHVWLAARRARGRIEVSSIEAYEDTVRTVVIPTCGELRIGDLTVLRCDRLLTRLVQKRSVSAARKARNVLSQVCSTAIRQGVLQNNPIRDALPLPTSEKKESYLTPKQLSLVRELMQVWRLDKGMGPRPDVSKLIDAMDIMVGTSARIGEVLGLWRSDAAVAGTRRTILIGATLSQTRQNGLVRKPSPKRKRQTRRVALPRRARTAVERRLSVADSEPDAYLFATRSGKPFSVSNYERILRNFVDENEMTIRNAGIVFDEFSSHMFRRTAATYVERAGGITLASRLLGHASEDITRASYVVTAEMVDPRTADIIDEAMEAADSDVWLD